MKFWTIWTLPAMTLRERLWRTWDEWFLIGLARRLPARLAYRSFIDSTVRSIGPNDIVPDVTMVDVLKRHRGGRDG